MRRTTGDNIVKIYLRQDELLTENKQIVARRASWEKWQEDCKSFVVPPYMTEK